MAVEYFFRFQRLDQASAKEHHGNISQAEHAAIGTGRRIHTAGSYHDVDSLLLCPAYGIFRIVRYGCVVPDKCIVQVDSYHFYRIFWFLYHVVLSPCFQSNGMPAGASVPVFTVSPSLA